MWGGQRAAYHQPTIQLLYASLCSADLSMMASISQSQAEPLPKEMTLKRQTEIADHI
jgi:hypothetical protein